MKRTRRVGVLLGLLAALAVVLRVMASPSPGDTSTPHRLVFDEGFAGGRLDGSRWSRCYWWAARGCTIVTNHELEWYLPGQVQVGRGVARLIAARRAVRGTDGRTYPFVSGMISSGPTPRSSAPKFSVRYGRVEARLRVPAGPGLWSAFWLLPADRSGQPEIDVMEIHGDSPGVVRMHLHYRAAGGRDAVLSSDWTQPSLPSGWHRYGINWRAGRLDWLIDGVVRWHVDGAAVPRSRMYLIADLAVGGDPVGAPTARTPFPSVLAIDWVRVWQ
jgi:beta-glucanase (GH16 family)